MRTMTITITEIEKEGRAFVETHVENTGFSPIEIMGLMQNISVDAYIKMNKKSKRKVVKNEKIDTPHMD